MPAVKGGLQIQYVDPARLRPFGGNPRQINEVGLEKLQRSVEEFGFINPIIAQRGTEMVIAGHQRLKAAQAAGLVEVPVVYLDVDDITAKAYNVADNRTAEESEWDFGPLADLLAELDSGAFDLSLTGFDEDEIERMMNWTPEGDAGGIVEDEVPEPPKSPVTKPGDLWVLGRHRLLCGDATVQTDIDRLMGGYVADMVFTDPPYNVDYSGKTKDALKIKNDKMGDDEFYQFLRDSFVGAFAATAAGGAIYVCHSDTEGLAFRRALVDAGWLHKQCLVWVKNSIVMGRQDYHWKHEPILYGWKPGASHRWYGGRKQSTVIEDTAAFVVESRPDGTIIHLNDGLRQLAIKVPEYEVLHDDDDSSTTIWRFEKPSRNKEHPTMKPVGIPARAIRNSTRQGEVVLDSFGGSGSTLIAAEQTNRSCVTLELDPQYCDVIVERWQNLTGNKAKLQK